MSRERFVNVGESTLPSAVFRQLAVEPLHPVRGAGHLRIWIVQPDDSHQPRIRSPLLLLINPAHDRCQMPFGFLKRPVEYRLGRTALAARFPCGMNQVIATDRDRDKISFANRLAEQRMVADPLLQLGCR
ncbi:hypothetical protein D3C73_1193900 [compost metagenome]